MLRWLGQVPAATLLMSAVENVTEAGTKTKDLGGSNTTKEVTEAVCREIENLVGEEMAEKIYVNGGGKLEAEKEKSEDETRAQKMVDEIMRNR